MNALRASEGYRLWAPLYAEETAVSALEDQLVTTLTAPAAGQRLLDAGCGIGRRMVGSNAAPAIGVDLTPAMLARAKGIAPVAAADVCALPFADASFDLVWFRLAIGHVEAIGAVYRELARVTRYGGTVVVTDFHPAAAAAGHRRNFRDADGRQHDILHYVHEPTTHISAAAAHGLHRTAEHVGTVGPAIEPFYAAANRLSAYERQIGLPLVLLLAFAR